MATHAMFLALGFALGMVGCAAAPSSGLFSLNDVEGRRVDVGVADPEGIIVLAFWATWCQPCQSELTRMDAMYGELSRRGLALYAISVDTSSTVAQVPSWVAREGYRFPVLIDSDTVILDRYHKNGEIPYYVVLDGRGRVLSDHQGYNEGDVEKLRAWLDGLLPAG